MSTNRESKPRVLVTGGAGYVGCVLIPKLLQAGHRVRCLDNLMYGGRGLLSCIGHPNFEFVRADVGDAGKLARALENVDVIIHLAALVGFPACKRDPDLARKVNYEGTILVDRLRSQDQKLIFASTGSNYGAVVGQVCTEDTPLKPLTPYGVSKTQAEQHVLESGNVVAFRFATAFGASPRMRFDLLINDFAYQALKNRALILYEKTFRRTFIHVSDMADAFLFAVTHWDAMRDRPYNVGREENNHSKADIAEMLLERVDFYLNYADIGEDEDKRNYEVSYDRIRAQGFIPQTLVPDGLDELIRAVALIDVHNEYSNA